MLWLAVWSVLVVGTLVGAFFLGRDLWRKGLALAREAELAAALVDRWGERVAELEAAGPASTPRVVDLSDTAGPAQRRAEGRLAAVRRRAARDERRAAAYRRWRALTH